MPTDPVEAIIAEALDRAGISYVCDDAKSGLDFAIAQDRMMLRILKAKMTGEQIAELEREAAEAVLSSGQFKRVEVSASQ